MRGKLMLVAAVAVTLGGCAAPDVPQETAAPAPSVPSPSVSVSASASVSAPASASTGIPVAPLTTAPPNGPTDQIKKTAWVVGTVTKDSSGPCYAMETDDGTQYALHASDGTKLVKGQRMRVKTGPMLVRMYCGPGTPLEMISSERL